MEDFIEKRRDGRIDASFDVLISMTNRDGMTEFFNLTGRAVNVSRTGILLFNNEDIPAGTPLELVFFLPNSQTTINISGTVVRTKEEKSHYLVAVEFCDMDEALNDHLDRILQKRPKGARSTPVTPK